MNAKRILIFASYFAPQNFSEALTNNKFVLALKKNGYDVTVISTSTYEGYKYENTWSSFWIKLKENTYNIPSSDVHSKNQKFNKVKSILALKHPINGVSWAFKAYKLAIKLHNDEPFDFVVSRSISDFGHLPALKFKKSTGIKWAANWNDPPFFLFPAPYQEKVNFKDKYFYKRYIKSVATNADYNTFPSKRLYDYMQKNLGVFRESNSEILPHLNTDLGISSKIQKADNFRICHAGNLSKERSPDLFLESLKTLTQKYNGIIECYIIGVENVDLKNKVKEFGLEEVVKFTGAMPYNNTLEFLKTCSVGLLIEAKCDEGIFLPSKISDYLHSDIPIMAISPKNGTMNDLIKNYGGGLISDNTDVSCISKNLEKLYLGWNKNKLSDFEIKELKNYLSEEYMLKKIRSFLHN